MRDAQLDALRRSTFWRLTAPLRFAIERARAGGTATKRATRYAMAASGHLARRWLREGNFRRDVAVIRRHGLVPAIRAFRETFFNESEQGFGLAVRELAVPRSSSVVVIVPVYRGVQETRTCLESVLSSMAAQRTDVRLMIVDDRGDEAGMDEMLAEIEVRDDRVTLHRNSANHGFVRSVNLGMDLAGDDDVVLLNSDTVVANDWVDRLRRAAYSDGRVASVTPFSNNATICSYPRFCEPNPLPPGTDVATLDALFAHHNAGAVRDIPTGVGFCFYLRRDALDALGTFDAEAFGNGYGEENDFCRRAAKAGWRNLLAGDTFVYHVGAVSFGGTEVEPNKVNAARLRRRHPEYDAVVHAHVTADPARPLRERVTDALLCSDARPCVLCVLHNFGGGTQKHVTDLHRLLGARAHFLELIPLDANRVLLRHLDGQYGIESEFRLDSAFDELVDRLVRLGVSHVHVHHLIGLECYLPRLLGALRARSAVTIDFTLHDHYILSNQPHLVDAEGRFAGDPDEAQNAIYMASPYNRALVVPNSLTAWRTGFDYLIEAAERIIAPSRDVARRVLRYWPRAPIVVVPHPEPEHLPSDVEMTAPKDGEALRVVLLGALSREKGARVLADCADLAARRNLPLAFIVIGYMENISATQYPRSVTQTGPYQPADLQALIAKYQPHVAWFPASCPEVFSFTLSEAMRARLPILASNIGAFPERLAGRAWTWVAPWDEPAEAWCDRLLAIRKQLVQGDAPQVPASPTWDNDLPEDLDFYTSRYLVGFSHPDQRQIASD